MTSALEYQEHATPSTAPRDSSSSSHDLTARLLRGLDSSSLVLDIRSDIETSDSLAPPLQEQEQCEHAMKSPASFNYRTAFAVMTERRVQRKYKGVYKQYSAATQLVTWVIVVYIIAVFAVNSVRSSTEDEAIFTTDNVFALVLNLLIVFFVVEIVLVVRWLVYWVIVAELATFAVTGRLAAVVWIDTDVSEDDQATRRSILVSLIVAEVVTIVAYVLTHYVYPWVVSKRYLNAERWWNISTSARHYSLTYRSLARFYKRKRVTVTYCGGLDALGQPHGFGVWSDSSFHGEHLRGQWDHGVPVGPFQSQESGSGYCFVNLRIAFCHNRAEASNDEVLYIPKHSTTGLHWGVASIECSVSGGFFSFLPQVHHLTDGVLKTPPASALECLPYLRTPLDAIHALDETVATRSFSFRGGTHGPSSHPPGQDAKEALVFLHGYNCPLNYGMNRLAQLLALGNFPTHIHPFVFSWPTGGTLAYFPAKTLGSESERTATDFRDFLVSLVDAGYASINVIAHSMGARIFFNALSRGLLDAVFCEHDSRLDSSSLQRTRKARLASLIFSNPDYPRDDFVREGGGYDLCRQFCHQITIYADQMDGALIWSELLVRKSLFDPLAYSMGKRVHMLHRERSSERRPSRWSPRWNARSPASHNLGLDLGKEAVEKNRQAAFPDVVAFAYSQHLDVESDQAVDGADEPLEYLDVDVIDTTWMDNNVHSVRHNYFNLNPTVIEDIRQIIVHKRRARARPGVMRSSGNVYIFLVAPSHVKND